MALIGLNGGLIGSQRVPNVGAASGLWTANEQALLKRAGQWGVDPNWADVRLLVGCNSLPATDESSFATPITTFTTAPLLDTSIKKFGAGSFSFPSDTERSFNVASTNNNVDVPLNTPFTWECWIYYVSYTVAVLGRNNLNAFMESQGSNDYVAGAASATIEASPSFFFTASNDPADGFYHQSTIPTGVWIHWSLVRESSNNIYIYQDGVKSTSTINSSLSLDGNSASPSFVVGKRQLSSGVNFRMDEVRITVGTARYTANFTPPTAAFPRG